MKKVFTVFMFIFSQIILLNFAGYSVTFAKNINENLSVTRDDKGVWFIKGGSLYDSFEAMGYCVAQDRLWQAELYRRSARGTLSEILGEGESGINLKTDIFMRTIGYTEAELQAGFDTLDEKYKTIINAYVAGFNRRIYEIGNNPSLLPLEFITLGVSLKEWKVTDVLAWAVLLMRQFDSEALTTGQIDNAALLSTLIQNFPNNCDPSGYSYIPEGSIMFSDLRWSNDPNAQTMIPEKNYWKKRYWFSEKLKTHSEFNETIKNIYYNHKRIINNLKKHNAYVGMGSYAWVVSGQKTLSGNSILYSGPQMGFSIPSPVLEGSIEIPGYKVSGMAITGIPGIIVGRTPHHAWSMQVGHAHTVDYYVETSPASIISSREEYISTLKKLNGSTSVEISTITVYRTVHGPVISNENNNLISWKYSHWGYEFDFLEAIIGLGSANNMEQFEKAIEKIPASLHICYADCNKNIAYWMSGRDPVRPENINPWLPLSGDGSQEWLESLKPRPHDSNPIQGFYGGWNNKSMKDYDNNPLDIFQYGPFHRGHVIQDFLSKSNILNFEEVRDLALNIATTDSFGRGGNTWKSVEKDFIKAVKSVKENTSPEEYQKYLNAIKLLKEWDGHFVDGGISQWVSGTTRADSWILQNEWIKEVIRLTFSDELPLYFDYESLLDAETNDRHFYVLFNVLLHALEGTSSGVVNQYDWFKNRSISDIKPETSKEIIVLALHNVLVKLGERPWGGINSRGTIDFIYLNQMIGIIPFAQRSTYAQCVEMGCNGPKRIETMFPLGESGNILLKPNPLDPNLNPIPDFDNNFLSMQPLFYTFTHRPFPLFEEKNSCSK